MSHNVAEIVDTPQCNGVDRVVIYEREQLVAIPFTVEKGEYSQNEQISRETVENVRKRAETSDFAFGVPVKEAA